MNERIDIENLCEVIDNEPSRKRIEGSMKWYMVNAVKNRRRFYILSFMTIILPLLNTLVNAWVGIPDGYAKNIVSLCSMLAALSASTLCLFKCQEKWILYRTTVERMKRLLSKYRAGRLGEDKNKDEAALIQQLEDCMDEEFTKWCEIRKKTNKPDEFSDL